MLRAKPGSVSQRSPQIIKGQKDENFISYTSSVRSLRKRKNLSVMACEYILGWWNIAYYL